ncbi:MAG: two-component regulator propeller domain-containing protein, partial [Salinivirgaceae bacterium]
ENGIFDWHRATGNITNITPRQLFDEADEVVRVRDFLEDRDGIVWVATNLGLLRYENGQWKRNVAENDRQLTLRSNWLVDLLEDESGSIWISNKENGVNIIHNKTQRFSHYGVQKDVNSLSAGLVFSFDQYGANKVLVGTIGGGLDLFDMQTDNFSNFNRECTELSKRITAIHAAEKNRIYLGTWGEGLQVYDPASRQVKKFVADKNNDKSLSNNTVICVEPHLSRNGLWIGTFDGLNFFHREQNSFTQYKDIEGLQSHTIFFIYQANDDNLWLGTRGGGLALLDTRSMTATSWVNHPDDSTSLGNNVVKFIYEDKNGYLWVATEMGFSRFDVKTRTFKNFTVANGLPNNNVWAILPDNNNNLWVSTNAGLAKVTLSDSSDVISIKDFGKNEGLLSLEFSQGAYLRHTKTGDLYFGGTEGFYKFNPNNIVPRKYKPPVHFTSIRIMDEEYAGDTLPAAKHNLVIPWSRNFLSFEFVGLDYTHQGNIQYQYKMEGQTEYWSKPSTRTFASFPDLKDGTYTFKVKTSNSEGIWNHDEPAVIRIIVTPPWWRTTLAYVLYFLVPLIGVIVYIRMRTRKLKHEKEVLEQIVAERTPSCVKKISILPVVFSTRSVFSRL